LWWGGRPPRGGAAFVSSTWTSPTGVRAARVYPLPLARSAGTFATGGGRARAVVVGADDDGRGGGPRARDTRTGTRGDAPSSGPALPPECNTQPSYNFFHSGDVLPHRQSSTGLPTPWCRCACWGEPAGGRAWMRTTVVVYGAAGAGRDGRAPRRGRACRWP
jgi:hypothetical protein